jgi:hypothetical protein
VDIVGRMTYAVRKHIWPSWMQHRGWD